MSESTTRIGVFGGSFDPPHFGHALLPSYVLAQNWADKILVAPSAVHPNKPTQTDYVTRLHWTRLAMAHAEGTGKVWVSSIEGELAADGSPSLTIRLLHALRNTFPGAKIR